jgi:signal transduction histidine kinase
MSFIHALDVALALTAALINCIFILLVLTRTSLSSLYVTFLFSCLAVAIWNFGDFMMFITADSLWFYFSLIGTSIIPAVMFHFGSILIRPNRKLLLILIPYGFCIPLAMASPLALVHSNIRSFVDGPIWNFYFIAVLIPLFTIGTVMLAKAVSKSKSQNEKSRLQYVLISVCIAFTAGATDLLQIFKIPIPSLGHLGSVVYSSVLAIGVFKHRAAFDLLASMRMKMDMLNELAAGIAHELRNPLSSIKGAAHLLDTRFDELTSAESKEYLCLISEEVDRLDGLLANYRSLVRPLKIEKVPMRINTVIEKTVALMRMNQGAPKIELNLFPDMPICHCDPQTLRQVFINLINNARESSGIEGVLRITSDYAQPYITITFTDSGNGIPPDILPHIFEPFISTKQNGMGLGLAICKRLVDLNGGTIEAFNEESGARFTIHLPAADETISQA